MFLNRSLKFFEGAKIFGKTPRSYLTSYCVTENHYFSFKDDDVLQFIYYNLLLVKLRK